MMEYYVLAAVLILLFLFFVLTGNFHPNFTSGKEMIWIGGGAGMAPLRAQIMHLRLEML